MIYPPAATASILDCRILIVDDEPRNLTLLTHFLTTVGFGNVRASPDSKSAVDLCLRSPPDVLLLDLHMPHPDGFAIMAELRQRLPADVYLPILVLTADRSEKVKKQALSAGARDFLTKPFGLSEVFLRTRNLLETRVLYRRLEARNDDLSARVEARTRELEAARIEVLERLSQAVEFRDDITGSHTKRVGRAAARLAAAAGLSPADVDLIRRAAPLHDVGKVAIPDAILRKTGPLTPAEFELMQRHTTIGSQILSGGGTPLMTAAESIARSHHERWDGGGYPQGLQGDDIPVCARVVAIVDVFDALTTARPYREPWPPQRAFEEVRRASASHFDPRFVEAFLDSRAEMVETPDNLRE